MTQRPRKKSKAHPKPPAEEVVCAILVAIYRRWKGRRQKPIRFTLSRDDLRTISCRSDLREAFLNELAGAFYYHDWGMLDINGDFAFFELSSVQTWEKIEPDWIDDIVEEFQTEEDYRQLSESYYGFPAYAEERYYQGRIFMRHKPRGKRKRKS